MQEEIFGGKRTSQIIEYQDSIQSKDILSFSYKGGDFTVQAKKEENKIKIFCSGGGKYNRRDGSLFCVQYETEEDSIFKSLQEVIEENQETKNNGYYEEVGGLPSGYGDCLKVEYSSGEKIYKSSNQNKTVSEDSINRFYKIFHEFVKKDGYDFTTAGSNVKLFDDADEEYLQGTWKGTHFGDEIEVTFEGKYITIKINNIKTEEKVEYCILEGKVKKNQLKEEIKEGKIASDYKEFNGVESFAKKNYFTLTAYFYQNAYSTCDLYNYEKPKEK